MSPKSIGWQWTMYIVVSPRSLSSMAMSCNSVTLTCTSSLPTAR